MQSIHMYVQWGYQAHTVHAGCFIPYLLYQRDKAVHCVVRKGMCVEMAVNAHSQCTTVAPVASGVSALSSDASAKQRSVRGLVNAATQSNALGTSVFLCTHVHV